MEAQLKRGIIEICVLATIRNEDSYGYMIVKKVSEYISVSESTLYPILKRLEASGAISVYSVEYNGRLRKYYRITAVGLQQIDKFLLDWDSVMKAYKFIAGEDSHEQRKI